MRTVILALALSGFAMADNKDDLKALAGTWVSESVVIEGAAQAFEVKCVIEGDKYTVTIGQSTDVGTVKLDAAKTPRLMDVTGTDGVNKGKTYLCIYELKDGKLTICYGLEDKVRPAKFESAKDSKTMLVVYKKK